MNSPETETIPLFDSSTPPRRAAGGRAKKFDVSDLWRPGDPLPAGAILKAIAERCGRAWEMPDLARRVTIVYNPRLRTTLGRAILDDNRVELNVHLLRAYPDELLPAVVHELAHLAAPMRYGKVRPHGREFKALMRAVNVPDDATHRLDTARLKLRRRRYIYLHRCGDCGMMFLARKPRRDCYCKACGPEMSWTVLRAPATTAGRRKLKEIMDSAR